MKANVLFWVPIVLILFQFCSGNQENGRTEKDMQETEKALIGANRILVKKDREKILAYVRRNNLTMKETSSGLWYGIQRYGFGVKAKENTLVTLKYRVSLLDGTVCYDSDSLGYKKFRLGQGGVESGLEEGVLLLSVGDKATFIMPPHLAHGLPGDGNKIPARSVIIYDVILVKVDP
jgi:FKBP-type peptidyl-prolyl cis-trans isomerase FkpA